MNLFKLLRNSEKIRIIKQNGFALIATLIFVFVISTMGIALLSLTSNEVKLSVLQKESTDSFYLADSGAERAISWLEKQEGPPNTIPAPFDGSVDIEGLGGGYYNIMIVPDFSTAEFQREYVITCTAHSGDSESRRTVETRVKVESFAGFAYFSDIEEMDNGTKIWFRTGDVIGGKLHSNDLIHISGEPLFLGKLTTSEDHIEYMYDEYRTDLDYNDFPNFEDGFALKADPIDLEVVRNKDISGTSDPRSLESIALGSTFDESDVAGTGVYLPNNGITTNGGIYINGNTEEITLGTNDIGNSKITVVQGGTGTGIDKVTTEIIIDDVFRTTTVTKYDEDGDVIEPEPPELPDYGGTTNGLLYVNGKVKNLHGDRNDGGLKGRLTIAATDDIEISGDVLYNSRVEQDLDLSDPNVDLSTIDDSLGLVSSQDIYIKKHATGSGLDPDDIEINAILMALGESFYYDGYNTTLKGTLKTFGGFIQVRRGAVGMFNSYSGAKVYGFTKDYHYDNRMASTNPNIDSSIPPYFPTTGNYEKISWREIY